MNWRRTLGQFLRHMTREQAGASLMRIQLRIGTDVGQPEIVRLTGLPKERITPSVVQQVCEKLAELAGRNNH